jgi:hypothetical protein
MSDDAAMKVVGLGALCDVSGAPRRDQREAHFDVSEFAVLDDGRRITLHNERGFSGRLSFDADAWLDLTSDGLKRDVLPDEDDTEDEHPWEWLVELCRARGIVTTVEELKGVPYVVVLGDRVQARLTSTD